MALKRIYAVLTEGYELVVPALAYAFMHRVLRNGITLTPVVNTVQGFNTYEYEYSQGRFIFGTPGNGEPEIITFIYWGGSYVPPEVPPGEVCETPMGVAVAVNDNHSINISMPPTGDFYVSIGLAANACGVDPINTYNTVGGVTVTTFPYPDGSYKVCTRRKCGSDTLSDWLSVPFVIDTASEPPPPTPNGRILDTHPEGYISSVTPVFYTTPGYFPVAPGQSRNLFHTGYTGALSVSIAGQTVLSPGYIYVRINGVQVYFNAAGNGINSIPVLTFTEADFFELEYTTVTPPQNFGARKVPADTAIRITGVSGVPYAILSGSLPLISPAQEMRGRHEGFGSSVIKAGLMVKKNQQVVVGLYKNSTLLQFIAVNQGSTGPATVTFNPISAVTTDDIFVALDYT